MSNDTPKRSDLRKYQTVPYSKFFSNKLECLFLNKYTDYKENTNFYTCECIVNSLTYICQYCYDTCHTSQYCKKYLIKEKTKSTDNGYKQITCNCGKYRHSVPGVELEKTKLQAAINTNEQLLEASLKEQNSNLDNENNDQANTLGNNKVILKGNPNLISFETEKNLMDVMDKNNDDCKTEQKLLTNFLIEDNDCRYREIIKFCIPRNLYEFTDEDFKNVKTRNTSNANFIEKASKVLLNSSSKKVVNFRNNLDKLKKEQKPKKAKPLHAYDKADKTSRLYCKLCLSLQFLVENLSFNKGQEFNTSFLFSNFILT